MHKTPVSAINGHRKEIQTSSPWMSRRKIPQERILMYHNTPDLTKLDEITLENVLDCLVERFRSRKYYTFAGSVLISMNPCIKNANSVEDCTEISLYENNNEVVLPPHVYSVGLQSLKSLLAVRNNQMIVVSGDSGAGKTTATQQLIRYFTERNNRLIVAQTPTNLDKRIYLGTLILESLGNASTVVNRNSSRFGRLVQFNYDIETGSMRGAQIRTCLLEKHRVSKCSLNERNFHIFYYILIAVRNGQLNIDDFVEDGNIDVLIPKFIRGSLNESDEANYLKLYQSFQNLNMTAELTNVFRIVLGILVLLNVKFVPIDEDYAVNDTGTIAGVLHASNKEFTIEDINHVEALSSIFGVNGGDLVDSLVSRKIKAGRAHRESIFRNHCQSIAECEERRSALTSSLYDALFQYLLNRLNHMLRMSNCLDDTENSRTMQSTNLNVTLKSLSLLDLYGFENLESNHLEQICINYANERLQQVHVSKIKSYFDQIIEVDNDFQEPIELEQIEKEILKRVQELQSSVFDILNEECLLNRGSSNKETFQRMISASKSCKYIKVEKFQNSDCPFIVKHYATDVEYLMKGMTAKNIDYIPPEFNELLESSRNLFVKSLAGTSNSSFVGVKNQNNAQLFGTNTNKNNKRGRTILQRFKLSVDELVNELKNDEGQDVHFIRCILPNCELAEGKIQMDVIRRQLFSTGIVDVIRIAGNGYPIRIQKKKFFEEFPTLLKRYCKDDLDEKLLVEILDLDSSQLKFGKTMVFMTENAWKYLRGVESSILVNCSLTIQRAWRQYLKLKEEKARERAERAVQMNSEHIVSIHVLFEEMDNHKISVLLENTIGEIKLPIVEGRITILQSYEGHGCRKISFTEAKTVLKANVEGIHVGNKIVSRRQIYHPPITFYTRKTALENSFFVSDRLKSKGIPDVLDFYSAISPLIVTG